MAHSDRELCSAWAQSAELGGWGLSCFCLPWLKLQLSSDPPRGPVVVVLCFTATKGLGQRNFIFTLSVFSKKKDGLCGFIHCGKLCFPSCSVVARASLSQALKPGAERVTSERVMFPVQSVQHSKEGVGEVTLTYFRHLH